MKPTWDPIEFKTAGIVKNTGKVWIADKDGNPYRILGDDGYVYYPKDGLWKAVTETDRQKYLRKQ